MLRNPKFFRLAMFAFGFALALPVAMTVAREVASASGYMLASGLEGESVCIPGQGDDCSPS